MKKVLCLVALMTAMSLSASASTKNSWPTGSDKYPSWPVLDGKYPKYPIAPKYPKYPSESKYPKFPSWPSEPVASWSAY